MEVEEKEITEDTTVFYVQAESFPAGIPNSFEKLHEKIGGFKDRHLYGVTACVDQELIYLACVKENFKDEGKQFGLQTYTIPKGKYLCTILNNWQQNLVDIPVIFDQLMASPGIKKQAICVEDYITDTQMLAMAQMDRPEM